MSEKKKYNAWAILSCACEKQTKKYKKIIYIYLLEPDLKAPTSESLAGSCSAQFPILEKLVFTHQTNDGELYAQRKTTPTLLFQLLLMSKFVLLSGKT